MIDTTPLGSLTAQMMEAIAADFGDDFQIRTVALVVEVDSAETDQILVRCSDDRSWLLAALLNEAIDTVEATRESLADREDDD